MRQATAAAAARSFTLLMSARIGHGGIAWRRSLGDGKRRRCSMVRAFYFIAQRCLLTLSCVVGVDANAFGVLTCS